MNSSFLKEFRWNSLQIFAKNFEPPSSGDIGILLSRLLDLDVSPSIILWVRAFLRDRSQTVCVNSVKSNELILNTGAPQGCVLSPILFSIYTNEIMSSTTTLTLIKFADDMALVARLKDEQSLSSYFNFIEHLISWFDESYLN